jgi:putative oxidoreductase
MQDSGAAPKLLFPGLAGFYERAIPFSWLIVRLAVGFDLAMHGWGKVLRVPALLAGPGSDAALYFTLLGTEFIGGVCIMLGLFTRFFAAAAAIELLYITYTYVPNGYSWLSRGFEYTLLWGWLCFAIALHGGGSFSLDRKIGKEL